MRQAADFPSRQMAAVFLINNYDHIISLLEEKQLEHTEEYKFFKDRQQTQVRHVRGDAVWFVVLVVGLSACLSSRPSGRNRVDFVAVILLMMFLFLFFLSRE